MFKCVGLPMLGGHCARLDFLGIGQATQNAAWVAESGTVWAMAQHTGANPQSKMGQRG